MKIKLKDDHIFKNIVDGVCVEIGGEFTEVDDKIGRYLLEFFPDKLEEIKLPKSSKKEG